MDFPQIFGFWTPLKNGSRIELIDRLRLIGRHLAGTPLAVIVAIYFSSYREGFFRGRTANQERKAKDEKCF